MDYTQIKRGSAEVDIVYKGGTKGGMNVTTLNASITELFPAVAFELGLTKSVTKSDFYQQIYSKGVKLKTGGVYKNNTALKAGKEVIVTAKEKSDMFEEKLGNALDLFKYILANYDRKKIEKIVWGYRNNTKPDGVQPNHKGDILALDNRGGGGKKLSDATAKVLAKYPGNLVLGFDPEYGEVKMSEKALNYLSVKPGTINRTEPDFFCEMLRKRYRGEDSEEEWDDDSEEEWDDDSEEEWDDD